MANFDLVVNETILNEGGYSSNPNDSGNWTGGKIGVGQMKGTKYGISAARYPDVDIAGLTLETAKDLYWRDYWNPLHLSDIDSNQVAWKVFDIAVNMGVGDAARFLQEAVGAVVDGIVGPKTIAATNAHPPGIVVYTLCSLQEKHYRDIVAKDPTKEEFLAGWLKRALETGDQFA